MVECHLAKVKVAGPNPVSRSTQKDSRKDCLFFILCGVGDGIAHSLAVRRDSALACGSKQGAQV